MGGAHVAQGGWRQVRAEMGEGPPAVEHLQDEPEHLPGPLDLNTATQAALGTNAFDCFGIPVG